MNKLDKEIKKYVNNYVKQAKKDYWSIISKINNEMYYEAIQMFNSYIDYFYSYETTSYIRHGQSNPGTRNGLNLYRSFTIKKKNKGKTFSLYIKYSGEDMNRYDEREYEYDKNPDNVLDYIFNGIRFPYYNLMEWNYSYHSRYFSSSGTFQQAIDKFDKDFYSIANQKFVKEWHKLGWI